ncbi:MAG: type I methionyl aminopeptidase [Desulfovibrio sp.]|jgi:methionyl aminopeptidase|nr:type I methionyl aminopeptidase [Desulfovibrio sp.]
MKKNHGVFIKNAREVACLAEANCIVANILDAAGDIVAPGLPTIRFEELARDMCADCRVRPAFLGYCGYPYAVCCSVNEQVVHGFPSARRLEEGDIVSIDMGVIFDGFVGDAARTWPVGSVSAAHMELMRVTENSLYMGIEQARPGNNVYDIGAAVQRYVESHGFNVVRRFVGHGVGAKMHEKPEVPNFRPTAHGVTLQNGMVIAIEPMVTAGTYEVDILGDKWTAVTRDGKYAAHFEHSVVITQTGPRILSISDRGLNRHIISA